MKVALILEYDGSGFHGWQHQPDYRTVQHELHKTIEILLRHPIRYVQGSGRTDTGVHARGQVAHFETEVIPDLHAFKYSISAILRGEVAARAAMQVPDHFHAQTSAISKCYVYTLLRRDVFPVLEKGRVWHVRGNLDIDRFTHEAQALVGEHDFTSLRALSCEAKSPVRRVESVKVQVSDEHVRLAIVGQGFLKNMVRIITGTLVDMAQGKITRSMAEVIAAKSRDAAGLTAPPQGLCLQWVRYPAEFNVPILP